MRLLDFHCRRLERQARIPFGFGSTTLRSAPTLWARVSLDFDGAHGASGQSADLLVPKWFDKNPHSSLEQDQAALEDSARAAARAWMEAAPGSLFQQWLQVYRERVDSLGPDDPQRLVRGFGVALVERAVLDAACRAAGQSFHGALACNLFGIDAGAALPTLRGWDSSAAFAEAPTDSVLVRHTVGKADALLPQEVSAELRGEDGHPCSLQEDIQRYGLRAFKLKLGGDPAADLLRLTRIAEVLQELAPASLITMDANEQYGDPLALVGVLRQLQQQAAGAAMLEHLAWIEQPLSRESSLQESLRAPLAELAAFAPMIIDEADTGLDAFPRALALGYRGVSVKNCKGVLRAVLNRGLCEVQGDGAFQAGEDLTNLPLVALQQDLATSAALRLPHVERNGHHYFAGLAHLTPAERAWALEQHPDLYDARGLRIQGGRLRTGSLQVQGFGLANPLQ